MQLEIRKILLIGLLAFLSLTLVQRWTEFSQRNQQAVQLQNNLADKTDVDIPSAPALVAGETGSEIPALETTNVALEGDFIKVETDLIFAKINTIGGEITEYDLKKHPVSVNQPDLPFQLLKDGGADVFIAQSGLISAQKRELPNHKTQFEAQATEYSLANNQKELKVVLSWNAPDGVQYRKIFTFTRDSYLVNVDFEVVNRSAQPWQGFLYAQFQRSNVETESFGFFGGSPTFKGGAIYTDSEKYQKISFSDIEDEDLNIMTDAGWVGMLQHYFVGVWVPKTQSPYQIYSKRLIQNGQTRYNIGYKTTTPTDIAIGEQGLIQTRAYIGPKEQSRLTTKAVEGLQLTVDYGWLTPVASPMFWVMNKIHSVVHNWGWTIVIVTILLKLMFFPLSAASYKSMARMKKFQPRLATLRERYGDDKQKLNAEMMKLYKSEKINPMGGCLPILVQIPVFIALYWVLLESVEMRQAPFIFWLKDLSLKDPFYVLPLLYGASMFVTQKLNPQPVDPMQQKIMMIMPVMFTFLFLFFPSGLVLYWLVNNMVSMAQQWYITRKYA